jgi:Protein of unknown function (DUF1449)
MNEFISAILTFPTVLFTILFGVVVLYWLSVLLGAADLDLLDLGEAVDLDGDGDPDGAAGFLQTLGLGGVPLTLSLSLLILTSWVLCILGVEFVGRKSVWISTVAAAAAFLLAVPATALAVRPLRRFFVSHPATENRSLVGKICTIATLRVDGRYGQAEIEDGGAGLLVQVRSTNPGLQRGDRAMIFDYKDEVFLVAPLDAALRKSLQDIG